MKPSRGGTFLRIVVKHPSYIVSNFSSDTVAPVERGALSLPTRDYCNSKQNTLHHQSSIRQ